MVYVFVYGTLRKGESNAYLLKNAICIAEQAWTNGEMYDTGNGYPAIKPSLTLRVYGELYLVTESELERLDQLEGYTSGSTNNLYERIEQTVYTDRGEKEAFVYVEGNASICKEEIHRGDWKEYRLLNKQKKPNHKILYFAYGSCMDDKRFKMAGVEHYFQNVIGVGLLTNYSLRFTYCSKIDGMGRADIVEEGGHVEGKVYEIPIHALEDYLYIREGVPYAYRPTFVTVELNGKKVEVLTFVVAQKAEETPPPDWYAEEILRGASGYLTEDYIARLTEHIHFLK
ncbi:gamma-glutamylcyclotransferase [Niallia sp. XMNu-256]|uniref:gamma-glutamylcyclotransferase n=1 Tax=Niallia sp. XMNu-256 TaxID=3082444 RepID=UPI0030D15801